jgi:hypothetical protein
LLIAWLAFEHGERFNSQQGTCGSSAAGWASWTTGHDLSSRLPPAGFTQLTLPVLTPAHGASTHVGGRQFAVTAINVRYDIQTDADQDSAKLRLLLTLDRSGDRMSGTAILDVVAPDGRPAWSFTHTITLPAALDRLIQRASTVVCFTDSKPGMAARNAGNQS